VSILEQETIVATPPHPAHRRRLLPFLAVAGAVSVSTIYYNQPLLLDIGRSFHTSAARVGLVAVATQIGYALGMLFFVPLGDVLPRRSLMVRMFTGVSVALVFSALAPFLWVLIATGALVGLLASVTHVIIPIVPELAEDEARGRALGIVMTGLLLGILLARTFSGAIASWLGWRSVFGVGSILCAAAALLLGRLLPPLKPVKPIAYRAAMRSLWALFRTHRLLRQASIQAGLMFASFMGFWTTLAFLLGTPRYHLGAGVAGSFGIIGAAGASIAPVSGWLSDRRGSRSVITFALFLMAGAWTVLWTGRIYMAGLVIGCILLDMAAQANLIANQTRVFGIDASARSRLNTVFMTMYFCGAALGSYGSVVMWSHWQWPGVTLLGFALLGLAALVHRFG
jgi:predicted MFS family arabinose efflux permease